MNGIIKNIEKYQEKLKPIQKEVMRVKNNNQIEKISKECNRIEGTITTDTKINSIKVKMIEHFKDTKEKWEITIDSMMIIGKYFERRIDYVNVMKTTKKYKQLTQMYHFNPISDISLFENIETQYLQREKDQKKEGMYRYVYWYEQDFNILKNKQENETFKLLELKKIGLLKE